MRALLVAIMLIVGSQAGAEVIGKSNNINKKNDFL